MRNITTLKRLTKAAHEFGESFTCLALFSLIVIIVGFLLAAVIGSRGSFDNIDRQVRACLETERYTLDQCVMLVGGAK